jgi:hypothetical protein
MIRLQTTQRAHTAPVRTVVRPRLQHVDTVSVVPDSDTPPMPRLVDHHLPIVHDATSNARDIDQVARHSCEQK